MNPRFFLTRGAIVTASVCAGLLVLHFVLSLTAIRGKSVTYDEHVNAVGGYMVRHMSDYRVDIEDGALVKWWGALFQPRNGLKIDPNDVHLKGQDGNPTARGIYEDQQQQFLLVIKALYQTKDESGKLYDGQAYVNRSRVMFALASAIAGGLLGWLGWKLAGMAGAIIATALYALDPNFLAHGPLVKNDVPLVIFMIAMVLALLAVGRRATILNVAALGLALAGAVTVKFSGILLIFMSIFVLLIRAALSDSWPVLRWQLESRLQRFLAAGAIVVSSGIIVFFSIWVIYGFQYSPDGKGRFNLRQFVDKAKLNIISAEHDARRKAAEHAEIKSKQSPGDTTLALEAVRTRNEAEAMLKLLTDPQRDKMLDARPTPLMARFLVWVDSTHLLPHAWTSGLLFTYAATMIRSSYLLGEHTLVGWWYYFPLAMLFKTPTATLAAGLIALGGWLVCRFWLRRIPPAAGVDRWALICILVPAAIYLISALTTSLNIGLRHMLPFYPLVFLGIALGMARLLRWAPRFAGTAGAALAMGLAMESCINYPNYLAFFNTPSGGSHNGINLLSDSNLDWGQDLPLLARWQKEPYRPDERDRLNQELPLYLCYFGLADPSFYDIKCLHLPGGWPLAPPVNELPQNQRAVIALSATNLQGTYLPSDDLRKLYRQFMDVQPKEVLGGSIYLYEWPVRKQ